MTTTGFQPATIAASDPHRPAVILDDGTVVTYAQLEDHSTRLARALRERGIERGEHTAVILGNEPHSHEIMWALQRSGLYFSPISWRLTPDEAAYVVNDCGAKAVIASAAHAELAAALIDRAPAVEVWIAAGGDVAGYDRYEDLIGATSSEQLAGELEGIPMTYSSGTTGRPKGVLRPWVEVPYGSIQPLATYFERMGVGPGSMFLLPTPLYHAMPMHWSMALHRVGATCVMMRKFDAERCLQLIEEHGISHGQFVPTMFVRLLKLRDEIRERADVSSLRCIIHSAAPCPVEVKRRMIEWWGPVIDEFYGASEGGGATYITAAEWMAHQGSVGRSLVGTPHVCDDQGQELPIGEDGVIWFEGAGTIGFHNDPEQSRSVVNDRGWVTFWDVGHVDAEGYLYLTDRKTFMIISGGVNIYPQEVEDVLVMHPKVTDCAVFGIPDAEFGEQVKAVVQPAAGVDVGAELEEELIAFCRTHLARLKCPKSIDFEAELPRAENGKLYKRLLRDRYRQPAG